MKKSEAENNTYNRILFVGVGVCIYVSFIITSMLRVVFHGVSMDYFLSFLFIVGFFCHKYV